MNESDEKKIKEFLSKVLFITGNRHKLEEAIRVLGPLQHLDIDLPEVQELDPRKVVLAKAKSALEHGYSPVLIEDTSFSLKALNGLPGPLIKWFLKAIGGEGLYKIAEMKRDHSVTVTTIYGLALGPQSIIYGEGRSEGRIVSPRGGGFGWDSVFEPNGSKKTFGEMSPEQKEKYSMRTIALHELQNQILKHIGCS